MARDEFGNEYKKTIDRSSRGGRRALLGALAPFTRYRGGVPYIPIRTGRRTGSGVTGNTPSVPFPEPPGTFTGTRPEWAVYWAHGVLGRKEFIDFDYIFYSAWGEQWDFFEYEQEIAIEIQGLFWHYEFQSGQKQNDQLRRIRAESFGITLIAIDEDHALADPVFYLREALAMRDHSRSAKGGA